MQAPLLCEMYTFAATLLSSTAVSAAELLMPTTTTFFPLKSLGLVDLSARNSLRALGKMHLLFERLRMNDFAFKHLYTRHLRHDGAVESPCGDYDLVKFFLCGA
jgi:hypothetical protein